MSARFLAWYTSAMFAVTTFLSLFLSVGRGAEYLFLILQGVVATCAVVFAVVGVVLQALPRDHRYNRSVGVRRALVFTAIFGTLFLMVVVAG